MEDLTSQHFNEGMAKWHAKVKELEKNKNSWDKINPYSWTMIEEMTENCMNCGFNECQVYFKSFPSSSTYISKKVECPNCYNFLQK